MDCGKKHPSIPSHYNRLIPVRYITKCCKGYISFGGDDEDELCWSCGKVLREDDIIDKDEGKVR